MSNHRLNILILMMGLGLVVVTVLGIMHTVQGRDLERVDSALRTEEARERVAIRATTRRVCERQIEVRAELLLRAKARPPDYASTLRRMPLYDCTSPGAKRQLSDAETVAYLRTYVRRGR